MHLYLREQQLRVREELEGRRIHEVGGRRVHMLSMYIYVSLHVHVHEVRRERAEEADGAAAAG